MDCRQQEYVQVMVEKTYQDFEALISGAGDRGMALHSWDIAPNGNIVGLFYPMTEQALNQRGHEIRSLAELKAR